MFFIGDLVRVADDIPDNQTAHRFRDKTVIVIEVSQNINIKLPNTSDNAAVWSKPQYLSLETDPERLQRCSE